jgi:hypothetical protein
VWQGDKSMAVPAGSALGVFLGCEGFWSFCWFEMEPRGLLDATVVLG